MSRFHNMIEELLTAEIGSFSRFFDRLYQVGRLPHDTGSLLQSLPCPNKEDAVDYSALPDSQSMGEDRALYLLNGNFNHNLDIQRLLSELRGKMNRHGRIVAIAFNPYLKWLYKLADSMGLREGKPPVTFLTRASLKDLARLSGFEIVRIRPVGFLPASLGDPAIVANRLLPGIPGIRHLAVASIIILRPIMAETRRPTLSVIIPARNERGNIENALKRLPAWGPDRLEIIFVEGGSTDGTWEEIQRVTNIYADRFRIQTMQQSGRGKNNAVRLGFSKATGDLVTILDADLTMPPEMLERFYQAWCDGHGDFINGDRLVYSMEDEAMRFLNSLGNIFFAKALGRVLDVRLGDALCGTKLLARRDIERISAWREKFGDFDPFGDFDILFGASVLGLGIVDLPIRYGARRYGETNISRFAHGWELLKMTMIGWRRLSMGARPASQKESQK
ncbi:MAG: glycosyltransferase family 2 protein [Candidatus Riflebacteria bacterium]|nr:glycosyltransferase family 2 protein [Candidatus Riflebacteria bacterium]